MNVTVHGRARRFRTVTFDVRHNAVLLIEQRLLPHEFRIVAAGDFRQTARAITDMVVRGAGAIGVTAAYGLAQGARAFRGRGMTAFQRQVKVVADTLKAARPTVDQSYFLYTLKQAVLPRLMFPLGGYSKARVRQMGAERSLPVAGKPKSQDLCFIPDGHHEGFLKGRIAAEPGDIVDPEGKVLGRHQGIAFYTVGQRTGLGIATGRRLFVLKLDPASNTVVVGPEESLLTSGLKATSLSFVCVKPQRPLEVGAKIRFRTPEVGARLKVFNEEAEVLFDQPQRAIAPGQAVVFYRGDEVLGGGIIEA